MIHPPAALLGLHAVRGAVRVRDRRAGHAAASTPSGSRATRRFALAAWLFLGIGIAARRALVLRRARLGRLLGLGPGRERLAAAVAHRHRVPALGDDPGAPRDAEGLERVADAGDRHARDPRHVPRALGDPRLDPRVRRRRRSACRSCADRGADRAARSGSSSSRRDALRSEHRLDSLLSREAVFLLNNLVLVALGFVVFWGTFFPLISEAITGDQARVGPPWFDRYIVPLALVLVAAVGHRAGDRRGGGRRRRTCGATSRCRRPSALVGAGRAARGSAAAARAAGAG